MSQYFLKSFKISKKRKNTLIFESKILVQSITNCHFFQFANFLLNSPTTATACLGLFSLDKLLSSIPRVYSTGYKLLTCKCLWNTVTTLRTLVKPHKGLKRAEVFLKILKYSLKFTGKNPRWDLVIVKLQPECILKLSTS